MSKTVLLTGGTDGIGFETAKRIVGAGHTLLLHGRSKVKLAQVQARLSAITEVATIQTFRADLSKLDEVRHLADEIKEQHSKLDVLINNAGVYKVPTTTTEDGFDIRLIVNTIAPYLLTNALLPLLSLDSRIINLSSAAQASVDVDGLLAKRVLHDNDAYAQSKLGITMWSFHLARMFGAEGPSIIAVNPASFLGSKMVKDAYGTDGQDLAIGADILLRVAFGDEFKGITGRYFDNDRKQFSKPHPDALNQEKNAELVAAMDHIISDTSR